MKTDPKLGRMLWGAVIFWPWSFLGWDLGCWTLGMARQSPIDWFSWWGVPLLFWPVFCLILLRAASNLMELPGDLHD